MLLNPPVDYDLLHWELPDDLPLQEFKYQGFLKAYHLVPEPVRELLNKMIPLVDEREEMRWVVDYKVRDLKANKAGCFFPGFHLDCVTDPWHPSKAETHLIYSNSPGTLFMETPIQALREERHFKDVLKRTEDWCMRFRKANDNTVTRYGRANLHASPIMKEDCRRVLLRVTQTQVI